MASIISSGTTSGTALNMSGDTSGVLQLATNGTTTAITVNTSQNVGIGTTSPNKPLSVYGGDGYIQMLNASTGTGNTDGAFIGVEGGTTALRVVNQENDVISFSTNGLANERMRIDSSGNVGIGITPSSKLHVYGNEIRVQQDSSYYSLFNTAGTRYGYIQGGAGYLNFVSEAGSANNLTFTTNSSERVRIDSSGNVGIGTTTMTNKLNVAGAIQSSSVLTAVEASTVAMSQESGFARIAAFGTDTATPGVLDLMVISTNGSVQKGMRIDSSGNVILGSNTSTTANNVLNLWSPTSTLNGIYMQKNGQVEVQMGFKASTNTDFYIGTGSSTMGTYGVYLANTGNSWTSVSDERQKDIIEPIENALTKVNTLRTVIGKYKHDADGVRRSFLIAQDVQAVFPEAVKVQEDEEALLGLSYTDVIPLLVASIKELKAINDTQAETINALTARIVALEQA